MFGQMSIFPQMSLCCQARRLNESTGGKNELASTCGEVCLFRKIAAGVFSTRLLVLRSSMKVYSEKSRGRSCQPDSYAVPLLRHGCAERATGTAYES